LNTKIVNKRNLGIVGALFTLLLAVGYFNYFTSNTTFTEAEVYIKIPTGSTFDQVKAILKPYVKTQTILKQWLLCVRIQNM